MPWLVVDLTLVKLDTPPSGTCGLVPTEPRRVMERRT
jgi:hypothetical protein